ncbi:hypothetical protein [Mycolicibacterium sp. CBMA 226]|uniref:hypothetical protein n=1 Tax=Mycolicibacterium sp. CBMA 226 TaxID=2606611 RepID=UPI0012DBE271|nr:hypothetical protein [Mycolicibacterium sp. CBMA 226]MUL78806.1 hypothetical protein [Mycolicibacterium sp. CBMA 226]QGW61101.1 hypothetical protein ICEMyc226_00069 [Mycolicibacterium sp.]
MADLLVLHPTDWSALRRIENGMNRFMTTRPHPGDRADSLWGLQVNVPAGDVSNMKPASNPGRFILLRIHDGGVV